MNKEINKILIAGTEYDIRDSRVEDIVSNIGNNFWYGVEWDLTISDPTCTRIGDMDLHRTLPVQSQMRGCLLADNGTVNKYLNPDDWTSEVRDGSQGMVMVEIPKHYRKLEFEGNKIRCKLSLLPLDGFYEVPKMYISSYEASLQHSTGKLCSVVNENSDYNGLDYNENKTLPKKPITNLNRIEFRDAARKRGSVEWNCYTYDAHINLWWLYVVEYATLDSKADYNEELTSEGFRQGGLGKGVWAEEITYPDEYKGKNMYVPCGTTDFAGNNTTQTKVTLDGLWGGSLWEPYQFDVYVPRYRGIENPFGCSPKIVDGIIDIVSPTEENGGDGTSKVYVCSNPTQFNDDDVSNYRFIGKETRKSGFIKELLITANGDIVPAVCEGGSGSTYYCNYCVANIGKVEEKRIWFVGGNNGDVNQNGFLYINNGSTPERKFSSVVSRLCYIPQESHPIQRSYMEVVFKEDTTVTIDGIERTYPKCQKVKIYDIQSVVKIARLPVSYIDCTHLDTSKWTSLKGMFAYNKAVTCKIDNLDTSNVTDLSYLAMGSYFLHELEVGGFDTRKVTNMIYALTDTTRIRYINVGGWDTSKVTKMGALFAGCGAVYYDLSRWDLSSCIDIGLMFYENTKAEEIVFGEGFGKCAATNPVLDLSYCENYKYAVDTLCNMYDRAANGMSTMTIKLHANTKALLTEEQLNTLTSKGYTVI